MECIHKGESARTFQRGRGKVKGKTERAQGNVSKEKEEHDEIEEN